MDLSFTKWAGAGNDFVLVDWRKKKNLSPKRWGSVAKALCPKKEGVGADGLLVLESSKNADFRMRIFNPDGNEAEMCGNGSRCAAAYVGRGKRRPIFFETGAGCLEAHVNKDNVKVKLSRPHHLKTHIPLEVSGDRFQVHVINTGVPHAVLFVDDLEGTEIDRIGREIRHHPFFQPQGTNVDFVRPEGQNRIAVRTYERGVEGETLACGTGVAASALVTAHLKGFSSPIDVLTRGGDRLKIFFKWEGKRTEELYLEGKVLRLFEGRVRHV